MRNVTAESMAILKNKAAIAVSQDPLGQMGIRLLTAAGASSRHSPSPWVPARARGLRREWRLTRLRPGASWTRGRAGRLRRAAALPAR